MMGASDVPESLGGGAAAALVGEAEAEAAAEPVESGSGNRWPPEETVALLNIRCGMDSAFRDASLKAPLWEEVSRKLGEAGFNRTAKKCKEKFENVYKYHRRTKDGRSGGGHHKHNARTYRFFHQLEALDNLNTTTQPQPLQALLPPPPSPGKTTPPPPLPLPPTMVVEPISAYQATSARSAEEPDPEFTFTTTTSSSSSDQSKSKSESETQSREAARKKKKKKKKKEKQKLSGFFERLMTEVMGRQEALQRQFIEAIDRCERERRTREEAWKTQELAKIKREQELLAKERAAAAAKDAAVIACLQKLSEKAAAAATNSSSHPEKSEAHQLISCDANANADANRGGSSSRWPKAEVEALIKIRTDLDLNQHNHHHPSSESGGGGGSKGPLWEDVSAAMKKMGYDRSSKRCKEKWENINKYFRRVKDRKRKRPQDSKTCPYFHQLDAIYRTKNAPDDPPMTPIPGGSGGFEFKPEELLMQMVGEGHGHRPLPVTDGQTAAGDEDEDEEDGDCNGGEVEGGDAYRIVPNNTSSAASMAMMG